MRVGIFKCSLSLPSSVGVPKEEKIQQQQQRDQASACRIAEESGTTANRSSLSLSSLFLFVCLLCR